MYSGKFVAYFVVLFYAVPKTESILLLAVERFHAIFLRFMSWQTETLYTCIHKILYFIKASLNI